MKNLLQRRFIVPFLILIVIMAAIGGLYIYIGNKHLSAQANLGNTPVTTVQDGGEATGVSDGFHMPDCAYDVKDQCKPLTFTTKIELAESVKNSTYIVDTASDNDSGGWYHKFIYIGLPSIPAGVRFLGVGQKLIMRKDYDRLFTGNEINSNTFVQVFSVHCSDDKTVLPIVTGRHCYTNDNWEDSYLFNFKGNRTISEAELFKYSIDAANGWVDSANSLETIKRMRVSNPAMFSSFPDGFIASSSPLENIDVVYSGAIENTQYGMKLVPKNKIEEISYFKDGSQTSIKL